MWNHPYFTDLHPITTALVIKYTHRHTYSHRDRDIQTHTHTSILSKSFCDDVIADMEGVWLVASK